ncbi:MAG: VWA domain-containing protein, partial [Verrucomicrobiales bacterium]|nr:VWA domain-containing protein [Verrucomicrobiales bacterium]
MSFLNPALIWLLGLIVIPLLLYVFRRKSKRFNVSTLVFFKTLAKEHQESAWLRRLKKLVSLLLTLIIFCAAIFALARLILTTGTDDEVRTVVVLMDRSASMAVEDEEGQSRLDAAVERVQQELLRIPENVGVALIAYDVRPEILQPRTLKRRELVSRIGELEVRPMAGNPEAALESAGVLAKLETPAEIWHLSDSPGPEPESPGVVQLEHMNVALPEPVNVGITAFKVRPVPLEHGQFEAYVQVALNEDAPEGEVVPAKLEVVVGGVPAQLRELELLPGQREGLVLKIEGAENQMLRLQLKAEKDVLPLDNVVLAALPATRPVVAAWIRPDPESEPVDPYLQLALNSIHDEGELEVYAGTPADWPIEGVDVAIFDRWLPEDWPEDLPVIVLNPPGTVGPVAARRLENGIPHDSIRVGNEEHPLLFRVSSSRIALTQTALFEVTGSLEPLWIAGSEPVLAAGEVRGQRIVLMGFTPGQSERLPLLASFPILMGNAVLWAVETSPGLQRRFREYATGDLAEVNADTVVWSQWEDGRLKKSRTTVEGGLIELDRIGIFETEPADESVPRQMGSAFLLSANESNVRGKPTTGETVEIAEPTRQSWLRGDLTWLFLALVALALLVESWLFHRHAVY